MISRSWVESQIEESLNGANSRENIYDLAMLIVVRDELDRRAAPVVPDVSESAEREKDRKKQTIMLTNHSADLDAVPTIGQIEDAIGAVAANTKEERQRLRDMRTWADIIRQKNCGQ